MLPCAGTVVGELVVGTVTVRFPEIDGELPGFDTRRTSSKPNEQPSTPTK
jgi:hypothetical protein